MDSGTQFKMPDFGNTEAAFGYLSDKELNRAILLFRTFKYPLLVKYGPSMAAFSLKIGLPVKKLIKSTIFHHFCGGESIEDSRKRIDFLATYNVKTILDYSVEGEEKEEVFEHTAKEIQRTILESAQNEPIPFAVFKVTGVGRFEILKKVSANKSLNPTEKAEFDRLRQRVLSICSLGAEKGVQVMIDAEESWIQPAIDALALEMSEKFNQQEVIVFNTLQMYRHDRLDFLKTCMESYPFKLGFKLVRGAYMEKERARAAEFSYTSPIQVNKAATDSDYDSAVELCIQNIERCEVVVGTHNDESCRKAALLMQKSGLAIDDNRIWFSQLLGMSDNISFNLAQDGYNVAKYVPYGPISAVLPYLGRRAQENSSVKGQSSRELQLLIREKKRRKG